MNLPIDFSLPPALPPSLHFGGHVASADVSVEMGIVLRKCCFFIVDRDRSTIENSSDDCSCLGRDVVGNVV